MKRIILFILIFIQTIITAQTKPLTLDIKSPNTYEIERRGNVPINLNMGTVEENIPFFSYDMPDGNNLNVGISYNSNGFIPSKKSTPVGYNWTLITGGQISRTVVGRPDDIFNYTQNVQGFLMTVQEYPKSNEAIYNRDYPFSYKNLIQKNGYNLENEPDRFNFSFMGKSGYFYIGNDGLPIISSENKLKISIDSLSLQTPSSDCRLKFSQIIITDDKGVKYYFGGYDENLEVLYNLGAVGPGLPYRINDYPDYYITSWHLRKVVYANNDVLYFENKKKNLAWISNFCTSENRAPIKSNFNANPELFEPNAYFSQTNQYVKNQTGGSLGGGGSSSSSSIVVNQSILKKVVPYRIKFENRFTIQFNYTVQPLIDMFDTYLINNIVVSNGIKDINKIDLTYINKNEYQFLSSVKKDDQNFDMAYYNIDNLPPSLTKGIDYWGFWNGKNATTNLLIPDYNLDITTGAFNITGDSRRPNSSLFDIALLKRITYPTGGFSEFEYEPNTYSKKVARTVNTNFYQNLVNESDIAGGARIKKITSNDGSGINNKIKEYKYVLNYQPGNTSGLSSGILENDYTMVSFFNQQSNGWYLIALQELSSNVNIMSQSMPVIRYSEVSEVVNGNLFTKTNFTDYSTNPDILNYRTEEAGIYNNSTLVPANYVKNNYMPYVSRQDERGKILKTIFYANNQPLKSIDNTYTAINNNNFVTRVRGNSAWVYFMKTYIYPYVLSTSKTTDFINNIFIETTNEYHYDNPLHNGITKINTEFSNGVGTEVKHKYANEKGNQLMISKNMIGIPLETESKQTKNGITQSLGKSEITYPLTQSEANTKTSGLVLPISVLSTDLQNIQSTEITYNLYDFKGNIQQYTTKDGIITSIIWGYKSTQPIAKIVGAAYSQVSSLASEIITASDADINATTEQTLINKLDTFRKNTALSNAQVTTYTYDPLIGVTSITPTSGIREVYLYDSANRLKEIRQDNASGKLLKEFKYNYKP